MREFQRDEVDDRRTWSQRVDDLRKEVRRDDSLNRHRSLGRLGELLRIGRNLDEAVPLLEEAVTLAHEAEDRLAVRSNTIRLATALQYAGRHSRAREILQDLIETMESSGDPQYLDFALQHLGKVYAEEDHWEEAVRCFERAAFLRNGMPIRESSERALREARELATRSETHG